MAEAQQTILKHEMQAELMESTSAEADQGRTETSEVTQIDPYGVSV